MKGDISNDRLAPSSLAVAYSYVGVMTGTTSLADPDYITIHVPFTFNFIVASELSPNDGQIFLALQQGNTFTEPASRTNLANLLGYTTYGQSAVNAINLLPVLGTAPGAIGIPQAYPALPSPFQSNYWLYGVDYTL